MGGVSTSDSALLSLPDWPRAPAAVDAAARTEKEQKFLRTWRKKGARKRQKTTRPQSCDGVAGIALSLALPAAAAFFCLGYLNLAQILNPCCAPLSSKESWLYLSAPPPRLPLSAPHTDNPNPPPN